MIERAPTIGEIIARCHLAIMEEKPKPHEGKANHRTWRERMAAGIIEAIEFRRHDRRRYENLP